MEQCLVGETEAFGDLAAIGLDLRAVGEFLRRHEAGFFQQRQIAIGVIVALDAGIAVPVPDAAEIAAMVDVAEIGDALFGQMIAGE